MQVRFGEAYKVTFNTPHLADEKFARRQVVDLLADHGIKAQFVKSDTQGDLLVINGQRRTLDDYNANERERLAAISIPGQEKNKMLNDILTRRAILFKQTDGDLRVSSRYSHQTGGTYLTDVTKSDVMTHAENALPWRFR